MEVRPTNNSGFGPVAPKRWVLLTTLDRAHSNSNVWPLAEEPHCQRRVHLGLVFVWAHSAQKETNRSDIGQLFGISFSVKSSDFQTGSFVLPNAFHQLMEGVPV